MTSTPIEEAVTKLKNAVQSYDEKHPHRDFVPLTRNFLNGIISTLESLKPDSDRRVLEEIAYELFNGWQTHYKRSGANDNEAWARIGKAKEILRQLDLWPPKVRVEG